MRSRCLTSLKPPYPPEPVVHDGVDAVVSEYRDRPIRALKRAKRLGLTG